MPCSTKQSLLEELKKAGRYIYDFRIESNDFSHGHIKKITINHFIASLYKYLEKQTFTYHFTINSKIKEQLLCNNCREGCCMGAGTP